MLSSDEDSTNASGEEELKDPAAWPYDPCVRVGALTEAFRQRDVYKIEILLAYGANIERCRTTRAMDALACSARTIRRARG